MTNNEQTMKNLIQKMDPEMVARVLLNIDEKNGRLDVSPAFRLNKKNQTHLTNRIHILRNALRAKYGNKHDKMYRELRAEVNRMDELYSVQKNLDNLKFLTNKVGNISINPSNIKKNIYEKVLKNMVERIENIKKRKTEFERSQKSFVKDRLDKLYSDYFEVILSDLDSNRRYGMMLKRMISENIITIPPGKFTKIRQVHDVVKQRNQRKGTGIK